ncbi:MAG TPA: QueT transporter family protein [Candidatus Binataceae bacterium]|nr:QueT transporter family protein [Candidatus Binataceae bacterium]
MSPATAVIGATALAPTPSEASGHELRLMWRNTRMVVLCVLSAALYAAILVPFKVVPLIPGVTELRPGNAIPVVCSMLFGPAAAWGSAIGNMIGDFFYGVGPGDIFGFFGNLAFGYIPYKVWSLLAAPGESAMHLMAPRTFAKYFAACLSASVLCAVTVGWGDNLLALRPFWLLGNVIIFNNMLAAMVLSPLLLAAVYPRVRAAHLLYSDVMPELRPRRKSIRLAGFAMLLGGEVSAWLAGNLIATGRWVPRFLPAAYALAPYNKAIAVVVSPLVLIAFAGMMLL